MLLYVGTHTTLICVSHHERWLSQSTYACVPLCSPVYRPLPFHSLNLNLKQRRIAAVAYRTIWAARCRTEHRVIVCADCDAVNLGLVHLLID